MGGGVGSAGESPRSLKNSSPVQAVNDAIGWWRASRVVAQRWRAGRVVHTRLGVRVGDAHLGLQAIWVPEEQAQDVPEVGDEPIGGIAFEETIPDRGERIDGGRLQGKVIKAAPPEHGDLAQMLLVPGELEDVELGALADAHHRHPEALSLLQGL